MGNESDHVRLIAEGIGGLVAAAIGGLIIFGIATRFGKNPWIQAAVVLAIAVLDFVVRTYYLPGDRFLIFAIYCAVGWAGVFLLHRHASKGADKQG